MFSEYEKEKLNYSQYFGDYSTNGQSTSQKWEEFQKFGEAKLDLTNIDEAPIGKYISRPKPREKLKFNSDLWVGVRPGGTKQKRLEKNQVLTEKSVSIVRLTPQKEKEEKNLADTRTDNSPKRIIGKFIPFDPPKILEGEEVMSATVINNN